MSKSGNWKNSERQWAVTLQEFGVEATRISRAGNYAVSTYDVSIPSAEWLKSDSKYSEKAWKSNRLLNETEFKYCKYPGDTAVLITKSYKERGQCATVDSRFMAMLIAYWEGGDRKELWNKYVNPRKSTLTGMCSG